MCSLMIEIHKSNLVSLSKRVGDIFGKKLIYHFNYKVPCDIDDLYTSCQPCT